MHIKITDLLLSEQRSEMKKKDLFSHFHKHELPNKNDKEYTSVLCSFINNTNTLSIWCKNGGNCLTYDCLSISISEAV